MMNDIISNLLFPALVVFTGVVAYVFWVRPILKQSPAFTKLYATETTLLSAISAKLSGLKQKLTTIFVSVVGIAVVGHDSLTPLLAAAGIDPLAYGTQLLPKVPPLAWPMITLGVLWLIQYFRNIADRQARANAVALLDAGHFLAAPAPGIPVYSTPSPYNLLPDKED